MKVLIYKTAPSCKLVDTVVKVTFFKETVGTFSIAASGGYLDSCSLKKTLLVVNWLLNIMNRHQRTYWITQKGYS